VDMAFFSRRGAWARRSSGGERAGIREAESEPRK
jgi:hypothetical protein